MNALRVLIVGAGIAGLAAARALHRAGFTIDIIEREHAWSGRQAGAGIYLPGNAARALRALELEDAVAARAMRIPEQRFSDHRGRLLFAVDVAQLWAGVGPCLALLRADLHAVLVDGIAHVPIRMGVQLRELRQASGHVAVDLDDGTRGEYELALGTDGINDSDRKRARVLLRGCAFRRE